MLIPEGSWGPAALAVRVVSRAPSYLLGPRSAVFPVRQPSGALPAQLILSPSIEVRWYLVNRWENTLRASLGKTVLLTWLKAKINRH